MHAKTIDTSSNCMQWGYVGGISSSYQIIQRLRVLVDEYGLQDRVHFILVPEYYTSQVCCKCHERELECIHKTTKVFKHGVEVEVSKRTRGYKCRGCQSICNRDKNAALNILTNPIFFAMQKPHLTTWRFLQDDQKQ